MKSSEIRHRFVEYFKRHGHAHIPSSSLIPENDPTLLFANAGMNQFKNVFLGLEKRDYTRAVTVQKCVRAGGKHNDLENVGFTARHHTFFEMLGNFSFGDYFKKEAIHYAWELLTKDFGIPKDRLYVTVHLSDDEAADIWHKQEGVPRERIFRFDKDNFWRMGDTGPCGPCTEIFYDHGPKAGTISDPFKSIEAGEDRFVEIWNNVFMQYYEREPGQMEPLPKPSVDTGAGLERMVAALQGKVNNYDTDLFTGMIHEVCRISGKEYITDPNTLMRNPELASETAAMRVLADHCRSTSFLIADGALPSNEGRGYVLRRIMRRAIRYGRKLSDKSFLPSMAEVLIAEMSSVYPELSARREHIISTIRDEEARFLQTLDQGTEILQQEIAKAHRTGTKMIAGEVVFKLYDTFGFPMDLTRLMAAENGLTIDESGFEKQMQMARSKAKASWKGKALNSDEAHLISFSQSVAKNAGPTRFIGYDHLTGKAKVVALSDGHKEVPFLRGGQGGVMICAETPFYAEGGGQVGDQGEFAHGLTRGFIHNTTKNFDVHLHHIHVDSGELRVGDEVDLCVAASERRNTASNHSATHLLHAALRKLLGPHVTQAGSVVDADRLRFDFTHNKPLTNDEIHQLELMVNEQIAQAHNVEAQTMKHKDALAAGALALFGEKYGEEVRVLRMGQFSCELCGGTHVRNTSQIRVFKIVSESGVSAGVRRIEAITGDVALRWLTKNAHENQQARALAGLQESWDKYLNSEPGLPKWIQSQQELVRSLERELKKAKGSQVNLEELLKSATGFQTSTGKAAKLLFADVEIDDREILAQLTDRLKDKVGTGIIVALGRGAESHPLIVSVTKDLLETYKAGEILKNVAATLGGKGGGRPDFAQGAVPRRDGLEAAKNYLSKLVGS